MRVDKNWLFWIWNFSFIIWASHSVNNTSKTIVRKGYNILLFGSKPWDSCSKIDCFEVVNNYLALTCIFSTSKCPPGFQSYHFWLVHYFVQIWSLSSALHVEEATILDSNVETFIAWHRWAIFGSDQSDEISSSAGTRIGEKVVLHSQYRK